MSIKRKDEIRQLIKENMGKLESGLNSNLKKLLKDKGFCGEDDIILARQVFFQG